MSDIDINIVHNGSYYVLSRYLSRSVSDCPIVLCQHAWTRS